MIVVLLLTLAFGCGCNGGKTQVTKVEVPQVGGQQPKTPQK